MRNLKFCFIIIKLFLKGNSVSSIQKVIEDYKFKTMMLEFRTNALLFGFDTLNYSDDELLKSVNLASKELAKCGLSVEEVGIAFNSLSRSMIEFKPPFV
jgi:hypothetical protein